MLAYLVICSDCDQSSKAIAASIEANPSVIRSLMSDLKKSNIITGRQGLAKPTLTRNPAEISIFDIYQAININHHLLHVDPETNPKCIVGGNIQEVLGKVYSQIEQSAQQKMKEISLQEVVNQILQKNKDK